MVKTTTGEANAPRGDVREPHQETPDDRRLKTALDLSDAEWGVIMRHANSRNVSPEQAVRLAIETTYGAPDSDT